jgi:glycosyltransferase involved in cell wall biosynthesis
MARQSIVGFNHRPETARMTTRRTSISVVYPVFNEEENIERAVHFAEAVLTDMTSDYEILIVNDASTDRSAEIAEALAGSNPFVKMFHHERNLKLEARFAPASAAG